MNVGVTGAGGFIGRHVLAALAARGHEAIALVRRTPGPPGFASRAFDVTGDVATALEGLDAVVHGAAYVPRGYRDPAEAQRCLEVNAVGTLNVLRACVAAKTKKVVVLSGNVYRIGSEPVAEDAPFDPSSSAPYYLTSKACADFYAVHFDRAEGLPVAILRPSNVYGPGLARGMIASFAAKLSAGEAVTVQDGGRYRADLVHVEDVAIAAAEAIGREARGPFNIGAGATVSALDIAHTMADLLDRPRTLVHVEPATGATPAGFPPLDITRATRALAYSPRGLTQGLSSYLEWRARDAERGST